jgi:hypothetical protein
MQCNMKVSSGCVVQIDNYLTAISDEAEESRMKGERVRAASGLTGSALGLFATALAVDLCNSGGLFPVASIAAGKLALSGGAGVSAFSKSAGKAIALEHKERASQLEKRAQESRDAFANITTKMTELLPNCQGEIV